MSGRVVDDEGNALSGLRVVARPSTAGDNRRTFARLAQDGMFSENNATTDADGHYSMLIQFRKLVDVSVIDKGHMARTVRQMIDQGLERSQAPDIVAVQPAFVTGRIVDVDTNDSVLCPNGVRIRVSAIGEGPTTSATVRCDGTYRLPILPGTSQVYFSSDDLGEFSKTWEVLDHPNPLTAKDNPVTVEAGKSIEVDFPVQLNKSKHDKNLQDLQGEWTLEYGLYVERGNARLPLTAMHMVDGQGNPLRFCIRGNQRIGFAKDDCLAPELGIVKTLCEGIAAITVDSIRAPSTLISTRWISGKSAVDRSLFRLSGDRLEIVCNADQSDKAPVSFDNPVDAFVLVAKRMNDNDAYSDAVRER